MEITPDIIQKALRKLQPDMSSGPDGVTPVPGCLSWQETLLPHLYCQSLPQARHPRTVPLILTSSHYTRAMMKQINWITAPSHFSVCVVRSWGLVSPLQLHHIFVKMTRAINQWAYKKGHSTERLLIGMTEDWRQALDNSLLVGVVFEDFQKAFDIVSHSLLLQKVQGLWSWIRDYMTYRSQATVVNGYKSERKFMKYGVPQGSVVGPTLFPLFFI